MSAQMTHDEKAESQVAAQPAPAAADPGPLGLAGFAMTTFVLSVFNAGLFDKALEPVVLPLALFYGGLVQLLCGMWELKRGTTFGGLAFTSYGAFWLSYAAFAKFVAGGLPAESVHLASGLFLLAWGIFTAYMTIVSLKTNPGMITIFVLLFATIVFLTIGAFAQANAMTVIGGWLGIATAVAAWYCSFAGVLNQTWGRTILPS